MFHPYHIANLQKKNSLVVQYFKQLDLLKYLRRILLCQILAIIINSDFKLIILFKTQDAKINYFHFNYQKLLFLLIFRLFSNCYLS